MSDFYQKDKHKRTWIKTPTIFQMENAECGAACLAMILAYYNRYVDLEQLRIDCSVSKDGCSAFNICEAAKIYGLNVEAFKFSMNALLGYKQPCIIHWQFQHFVVYEGIKNGHVYINDPAQGRRKITFKELSEGFTGIALTFKKNKNFKTNKKPNSIIHFLIKRTHNQKGALAFLFIASLMLVMINVLVTSFSKIFIDNVLIPKNYTWFLGLAVAMVVSQICYFTFSNLRNIVVNKLQLKLSLVFGYDFISQMIRLPINFYEQRYSGDLSQRISNNDQANMFISGKLVGVVLDIISALFYLVFMTIYNIPLTGIGLVGLALSLMITYKLINSIKDKTIKYIQDNGNLSGFMFSGLDISSTIKACGIEDLFIKRIINLYNKVANIEQQIGKTGEILKFLPALILQFTSIIILIIGSTFVVQGHISMGILVAFGSLYSSFISPVKNVFNLFQDIQNLRANLKRVEDIENHDLDVAYTKIESSLDGIDDKLNGNIKIKNLKFGYSKNLDPLFNDVSIDIDSGEVVAIVGPSGSGKSSIIKLLCGLYQLWEGQILYDDKDLMSHPSLVLSSSISAINQEIVMYSDTIYNNLTFWNTYTLDQDVIDASKDACIYDTIVQLPEGFNYKLNQGAKNLSAGQRQRVEIARALSSNPSILLMDEATSSLDPITEKEIIDNVRRRGCTCIIVAHRLSTIRDADKIICLENGKIVQMGTHNQLKNIDGMYKELIKNS